MHEDLRSTVEGGILLVRDALGLLSSTTAARITPSEEPVHAQIGDVVDIDVDRVEPHREDDGRRNVEVPTLIEVGVDSVKRQERKNRLLGICVNQQDQDGSVEEGSHEDNQEDGMGQSGLSVEANLLNKNDVDLANDNVENNNAVGDRVGQNSATNLLPCVLVAWILICKREILGVREVFLAKALVNRSALLRHRIGLVYKCKARVRIGIVSEHGIGVLALSRGRVSF